MANIPPFEATEEIVNITAEISILLKNFSGTNDGLISPKLRKENQIKTIQSTLAIEQNTLSFNQVTDIVNGKRILGPEKDILEVKNAITVYQQIDSFNPLKVDELLRAHSILMQGLISENGRFRSGNVGVFAGTEVIHMAPPAKFVPQLISDLFGWYQDSKVHPLIKSAVFHYEFEFIHPFADGNGRMGRLWHTLLLSKWNENLKWIAVEELIKQNQSEYYHQLNEANAHGESTNFVLFMLHIYKKAIERAIQIKEQPAGIANLIEIMDGKEQSASEIMDALGLKNRAYFRKKYLKPALDLDLITMTDPEHPNSPKQKYRLK